MKDSIQKFLAVLPKYRYILIIIKGSPDPDAIASSFALQKICEKFQVRSTIVSLKKISLPVNREFVQLLDIPIRFVKKIENTDAYDAYAVLDHQSARIEGLRIPCAFHIDHHDPVDDPVPADFSLIEQRAGSTSSILSLFLKDLSLSMDIDELAAVCTALLYGIHTDTDKYDHAGELDYEALNYISQYSNNLIIEKLTEIPLSKSTVSLIGRAITQKILYKDWLIAGIGYVDAADRDSIPIAADFLLKRNSMYTVIVFAAVEDKDKNTLTLDASFRARDEHMNLNDIIKEITDEGGARKFKGAYQINLDYFSQCPDKKLLWDVIHLTTMEVLKNRRDGKYFTELKGFFRKLKDSLTGHTGGGA